MKTLAFESKLKTEIKEEMKKMEASFAWEKISSMHYEIYKNLLKSALLLLLNPSAILFDMETVALQI